MKVLHANRHQFFRAFDAKLVDKKKPGRFIVNGGVGFWKDMVVRVKPRTVAVLESEHL